jgi:parallel beta-helix repeat protein
MARLPQPGSDVNRWGDILNDFLRVEHNEDGTLKVTSQLADKVSLGGDLDGSVDSPHVTSLHLSSPLPITSGGTGSATQQFPIVRGAWTAQTAYKVNDIVTNGRAAWRCMTAHTSSNVFQSQVISGFWEQWAPRTTIFNVMDYGAKVDGSTDDTTAVQNAINAAYAAGGGSVCIPQGFCMTSQTIELKKHVWLRGAGMFATSLKLLPGANCDVIKNHVSTNGTSDPNADFVGILDITIDGNKANQTSGTRHGIVFNTNPLTSAATGDNFFDMHQLVQNVRVYKTGGDGVHLAGRSETRLHNVFVAYADGYGFYLTFDTFASQCTSESAGLAGFYSTSGAFMLSECKSFNSGQISAVSGAGYYVNGSVGGANILGCYAQNNQAQGFFISNSAEATITGCTADSNNMSNNSYAGFEFNSSSYCIIGSCISMQGKQGGVQVGNQMNALRLFGGADKNTVSLTHSGNQSITVSSVLTSDSVALTNTILANGSWLNPVFENQANKGIAGGYAPLDSSGVVPTVNLPTGSGGTPDATTSSKGLVQLAGDLGGTAALPTVPTKVSKTGDSMTGSLAIVGTASADILTAKTSGNGNGLRVDQFGNTYAQQKFTAGSTNAPHTLNITGSFGFTAITTASSDLTLSASHGIVVATQSVTITLPSTSGIAGRVYCIVNSSTGSLTVNAASSQTVLGSSSANLPAGGSLLIFPNGTNWYRFGSTI